MLGRLIEKIRHWFSEKEWRRISKLNRYVPAEVTFLGKKISILDNVTFLHSRQEIFVEEAYKFKTSNPAPVIIDCGANIGLSVVYFKKTYPNARIVAFEPDPDLFKALVHNIAQYDLSDVTPIEAACWIEDGFASFQKEGAHSGSLTNFWNEEKRITVRTERIDKYLDGKIDLLKMDIEGAEYEVLMSLKSLLPKIENIVFEYHSKSGDRQKLADLLNVLTESGYRYHIKESFTRKRPLYDTDVMLNMDLQLNIYGTR